ncbi:hypothetical protein COB21_02925 [Candidatus Aerophobetes bacterium]|uniref:Uncharacterized protein n=1 Tax=Aerophobetes bacterium TaxID=2030807 RepID=A0A2A4X691_UNCAE|nr:MAG: hypothetical protein COB21_02925 [Candidatus Aerophobetes bacterium]
MSSATFKKTFFTTLTVLCIVLGFELIAFFLTFSDFLDFHNILIHSLWIYPKPVLWGIWIVKTVLSTLCITRVYLCEPSEYRSRILKLWALFFILDILWPLAFLWLEAPLLSTILVTCMLPTLFIALLLCFLIDKPAAYALIIFGLMIVSKAFLHWEIYLLKINAL